MGQKEAVQVVILNKEGEVLAVSRKNDHNDFGLVAGKVDEGETTTEAIIREAKEETGLNISNLKIIFSMHKYGYMGYTYLCDYNGEINTNEPHVVKWTIFQTIMNGSFGKWNKLVAESLISMGIKFKVHDEHCELCNNTGKIAGIFDEDDIRTCHGIKHLDTLDYINNV